MKKSLLALLFPLPLMLSALPAGAGGANLPALDSGWANAGALQRRLLDMKALHRAALAEPKGFEGSGADFFDRYKPYIHDGKTIVVSHHKMYGPESNDLVYQLRSRGIDTVAAPGQDAYKAALVNYGMIANGVLSTDEAVQALGH